MNEVLLKKRYGIPVALLLALLFSGTALVWYCFVTVSSPTTVEEPLLAANNEEFSATMCPGGTRIWPFKIMNSADVDYKIKADLTFSAPSEVSITKFMVAFDNETGDLLDNNSATFDMPIPPIPENGTMCIVVITAENDAAPGYNTVRLEPSRE